MRKVARPGGKYGKVEVPLRAPSPQIPPILYTALRSGPHILEGILDYLPQHDAINLGMSTRQLHGLIASLAHSEAYGTRDRNDPFPDPYFQGAVLHFANGDCSELKRYGEPGERLCRTTLYNPTARLRQCEGLPANCPPKPYPGPYAIGSYHMHNPGFVCEYDNMINKAGFEDADLTAMVFNLMGVCDECRDQELRRIYAMLQADENADLDTRCQCDMDIRRDSWRCYCCREWARKGLRKVSNAYRQRLEHVYRDESNLAGARVYFDYTKPPHPDDQPRCRCGRINTNAEIWESIHMCTVCKMLLIEEETVCEPTEAFMDEAVSAMSGTDPVPTTIIYE